MKKFRGLEPSNMSTRASEREALLKRKKAERRKQKRSNKGPSDVPIVSSDRGGLDAADQPESDYEIEYIPEPIAEEYESLMSKFVPVDGSNAQQEGSAEYSSAMVDILDADAHRKAMEAVESAITGESARVSNKEKRLTARMPLASLKAVVSRPDLVDGMDNCSPDPTLLLFCKGHRNAVQVPRHWSNKRNYLANKRGVDKLTFKLPEYIEQTGIAKIRQALIAKEAERDIKAKQRSKMRPKTGKLDIDYQVLYNAFFKFQTKPAHMTKFGDIYYEGREAETRYAHKRPGHVSPLLREALGMIEGCPPPWLINMQRFGPPPSYPHLKIAGLNSPIPVGSEWGYHPGGWGKPPMDEFGNPTYGGLWNPETDRAAIVDLGNLQARKDLWGEFAEEESEDEEEEVKDVVVTPPAPIATQVPQFSQGVAVALAPPSAPVPQVPSGISTEPKELYRVLPRKEAPVEGGQFLPSKNVYEIKADISSVMLPTSDAADGLATAAGIAQRATEADADDVVTAEMIKKQLAEHESKAADSKKKKKQKFKF